MKTLLSIIVSAAFAVTSFGALAQDKKKEEVKSPSGAAVKAADKSNVTTATGKPKKETKGEPLPKPKNIGKRKDEKERMEKK